MDSLIDSMHNGGFGSMDPELEEILIYYRFQEYKDAFEKLGICNTFVFRYAQVLPHFEYVVEWRKIHNMMWKLRVGIDIKDRRPYIEKESEWWPKEEDWVLHHSGTCCVRVSSFEGDPYPLLPESGSRVYYV